MFEVRVKLSQGSKDAIWVAVQISVDVFRIICSSFFETSIAIWKAVKAPLCNGWWSSQDTLVKILGPKAGCEIFERMVVVARQTFVGGWPLAAVSVGLAVGYSENSRWQDHDCNFACGCWFDGCSVLVTSSLR
jgi:hypothetical protein